MAKILITGGAGFIGSNLVEYFLNKGHQIVCLDNFSTGKPENIQNFFFYRHFKLVVGDIRNYEDCERAVGDGVDYIMHQAALGSVPRSINDPITSNAVNITGFLNMLHAAKEKNVKRFIYAASSSTYGDSKELPKVEDRIGKPLSPYAITKYVNELYANNFSELYGVKTIGLRYFNVFGKNQDTESVYAAVIPKFVKIMMTHLAPTINGDGEQSRDFTFIENVIHANEQAMLSEHPNCENQVYNVSCGKRTTVNELFYKIRDLLSKYDEKIGTLKPEYGPERLGDIKHSLASVDKASKFLDYKPKYDVNKGLEKTIIWYWENLKV